MPYLMRSRAYKARAGGQLLPKIDVSDGSGGYVEAVDDARIQNAIDEAHGVCRVYIASDIIQSDGTEVPESELPIRLGPVLDGIIFDIARFKLAEGDTTGESDMIVRRHTQAIVLLKELQAASAADRAGDGPAGMRPVGQIVYGTSKWIPTGGPIL